MEALGIDPKLITAQLINIGILYYLVNRYLVPHLKTFIEKKKTEELQTARLLAELEEKSAVMNKKEEELKIQLRKERDELLKLAKTESQRLKEELSQKAQKEAESVVEKARTAMRAEQRDFEQSIQSQLSALVTQVLEKGFKDVIKGDVQKAVRDAALDNYERKN